MDLLKMQRALDRYLDLPLEGGQVAATYVFIDMSEHISAKTKTLDREPQSPEDVPIWTFGVGDVIEDSEVTLIPVALFKDPFLRGPHKLVVCDAVRNGQPFGRNTRSLCKKAMDRCADEKPMFGMEQEFTIFDLDGHPFGWPKAGRPKADVATCIYLYGVGSDQAYGRAISTAHYMACLYAGVKIGGTNPEGTPAQWEYQIGPCEGISIGDHMLIARYILLRCSEDFGVVVTFDPKPIEGPWCGSGCHTNFSTQNMREPGGMRYIHEAIEKLSKRVDEHLALYDPNGGRDNERRFAKALFCPKPGEFTWGVSDRGATIRIPRLVAVAGCGYFEDRRPSSNCNPYDVARRMVETVCLDE